MTKDVVSHRIAKMNDCGLNTVFHLQSFIGIIILSTKKNKPLKFYVFSNYNMISVPKKNKKCDREFWNISYEYGKRCCFCCPFQFLCEKICMCQLCFLVLFGGLQGDENLVFYKKSQEALALFFFSILQYNLLHRSLHLLYKRR